MANRAVPRAPQVVALGRKIAKRRRELGITLDDLSRRMKISKGNLSDIERGKRDPRFSTLLAIARGLQTNVCALLPGRTKRPA